MKDPVTAWVLVASLGAAASIEVQSIYLLGVSLSLLLACFAGAVAAVTLMPMGTRTAAVIRVVIGTWIGAYATPAAIASGGDWTGQPAMHKLVAVLCGALALVVLHGLMVVARRAPLELWERWSTRGSRRLP